uniref:Calx-beta domain-containing protein n=1 Tax=Meloidogyne enterolobii TaxID=390850 RepID=A0A6V7UR60_MELEN|nr:unnamed protein product [Meloidogyne enterolobii]
MFFFFFSFPLKNNNYFQIKTLISFFLLLQFLNFSNSQQQNNENNNKIAAVYSSQKRELIYNGEIENNKSEEILINNHCSSGKPCKSGLIIPVSLPIRFFRAFVYLLALLYLFYGISIVSDRFMAAIEVITSQEREVEVTKVTGEKIKVLVRVWNETVSNLTLMALGSSAPEILLSVIEIFGNNFEAGDLGPSTIVGSAAFNLFIIVGICILACQIFEYFNRILIFQIVPSNEIRRIDRIDVFWVTVIWSTFAYIWLFLILCVFSPNIVEVWEGLLTLLFFPLTVGSAFIANKHAKTFGQRLLGANAITSFRHTPRLGKQQSTHVGIRAANGSEKDVDVALLGPLKNDSNSVALMQQRHYLDVIKKLRAENPNLSVQELERLASNWIFTEVPKSRAFYRIQAIRKMTGNGDISIKRLKERAEDEHQNVAMPLMPDKPKQVTVGFDPAEYCVLENVGTVELRCVLDRGSLAVSTEVTVTYTTIADTAAEYEDFIPTQGVLTFGPSESEKFIEIGIVDNDEYEDDEQFFVKLTNLDAHCADNPGQKLPAQFKEGGSVATVMIIDDDHSGAFSFTSQVFRVPESQGQFALEVRRHRGARGTVILPFKTIEGSAKEGKDYTGQEAELLFYNNQTKATIYIEITNDDEYEKSEDFYVELGPPRLKDSSPRSEVANGPDGRPILGEHHRCKIVITEDREFKNFIDKMIANANVGILVGTHSWRQQFIEALTVEDIDGDGSISNKEKALHGVSVFWKLLFALIPPTDYINGWLTFFVSIFVIGILTAFIGDIASLFGCTIGLRDSVTAITLVAMGTSLPDTFASKTAAIQDKTADSSIGNVTGSNAVNVFLGIGLAWAIAAVYHSLNGGHFIVEAGSLASSVTMFILGSVVTIGLLQWRRYNPNIAGELGGPRGNKLFSFLIFLSVWLVYIVYSTLVAYCLI